jgi:hypothetical protein
VGTLSVVLDVSVPQRVGNNSINEVLCIWQSHPQKEKFIEFHRRALRVPAGDPVDR